VIARRGLRHLVEHGLRVAANDVGEFGMLVERTPEAVGAHPERLPGHLADRLQRSAVGSEEQRDPDDAFVSDCGDLDPFAALQADDERDHARERKPRVGDGSVRLIEYLPDGQGDLLHPGQEPDLQVVAEAGDGAEALAAYERHKPDVTLLDLRMPVMEGVEAVRHLREIDPQAKVIVLTTYDADEDIARALQAGASGYLLKDSAATDLRLGVAAVAAGKSFFSPAVAKIMLDDYVRHLTDKGLTDRYDSLSEREREIFQLIAEGRSNKETAELLGVSPATVETHRGHILQKLDVHNTAELVLYAVRKGIIS